MQSDDSDLLARCRRGDWSGLVERYGPAVRMALRVRMKGLRPADLEDLCQEAWAHLMETGLGNADPSRSLGPYLVTAALNLCRRKLAVESRRGTASLAFLPEPEAPAAREPREDRLGIALEGLSPRDRLILTLVEIEGLPAARVAEALGVSVRSVSSLAARSRRRLKRSFEKT